MNQLLFRLKEKQMLKLLYWKIEMGMKFALLVIKDFMICVNQLMMSLIGQKDQKNEHIQKF